MIRTFTEGWFSSINMGSIAKLKLVCHVKPHVMPRFVHKSRLADAAVALPVLPSFSVLLEHWLYSTAIPLQSMQHLVTCFRGPWWQKSLDDSLGALYQWLLGFGFDGDNVVWPWLLWRYLQLPLVLVRPSEIRSIHKYGPFVYHRDSARFCRKHDLRGTSRREKAGEAVYRRSHLLL